VTGVPAHVAVGPVIAGAGTGFIVTVCVVVAAQPVPLVTVTL
jgi:hypothetical protein